MNEYSHKLMVIENIATMAFTIIACKIIGVWGLILLLNISYPKRKLD